MTWRTWGAAAVALAAAGCLDSAPQCDDGSLCPVGAVCLPAGGCATPAQVAACDGAADLAPCEVQGVGGQQGVCLDGACNFGRCGDGLVEPRLGEVCDLALTAACARDCASDLSCGNGIVDAEVGESCDDGNDANHDGCSVRCTREVATWNPVTAGGGMAAAAASYDPLRRMVVVFGGYYPNQPDGPLSTAETWEIHRTSWIRRAPLTAPPARTGAALAFHGGLGATVLFGGATAAGPQADTWLYDGATWRALTFDVAPPPRVGAQMVYDAGRDRVVLAGGSNSDGVLRDTWEFDGAAWTEHAALPPGDGPALAYDPRRGRVVAVALGEDDVTRTWTYDGTSWAPLPGATLSPRTTPALAFDMRRGMVVLFGGYDPTQGQSLGDMWQLDGATWTGAPDAPSVLGQRASATMVYDRSWHKLLVGGGYSYSGTPSSWYWGDQDGWPYGGYATPYSGGQAVWDARAGLALTSAGTSELWHRVDAGWQRAPLSTATPYTYARALAYDPLGARLLLVSDQGPTLDVQSVSGDAWVSLPSVGAPPSRADFAVAFDAARGELVLAGGQPDETWTYNGAAWTPVPQVAPPPPRRRPALAYDPIHARVVMFGGEYVSDAGPALYRDTWTFDGTTWTELATAEHPPARAGAMLTFDPGRGTMILLGGNGLADAWELDGDTWRFVAAVSSAASYGSLVYDAPRGELMWQRDAGGARLWLESDGVDEACGSGRDLDGDALIDCADPDCWTTCTPTCSPVMAAAGVCDRADPAAPRCGDGTCAPYEVATCAADCGAPAPACGDDACDATETAASCPGDCR